MSRQRDLQRYFLPLASSDRLGQTVSPLGRSWHERVHLESNFMSVPNLKKFFMHFYGNTLRRIKQTHDAGMDRWTTQITSPSLITAVPGTEV